MLGYTHTQLCLESYASAGDSNSGPHARTARTLATELSSKPFFLCEAALLFLIFLSVDVLPAFVSV